MKTILEIKNEVAKEIGYDSWEEYMKEITGAFYERQRVESAWEEVAKRLAEEFASKIQLLKKEIQEWKTIAESNAHANKLACETVWELQKEINQLKK